MDSVAPAGSPEIEADEYLDLRLRWRFGPCLYYRVSRGGRGLPSVELKLDPTSGTLIGLTVQNLPRADRTTIAPHDVAASEPGLPVFDRSAFELNPDRMPETDIVTVDADLGLGLDDDRATLWFDESDVVRSIGSGPAAFVFDADDALVAITVDRHEIPPTSQLASQ